MTATDGRICLVFLWPPSKLGNYSLHNYSYVQFQFSSEFFILFIAKQFSYLRNLFGFFSGFMDTYFAIVKPVFVYLQQNSLLRVSLHRSKHNTGFENLRVHLDCYSSNILKYAWQLCLYNSKCIASVRYTTSSPASKQN